MLRQRLVDRRMQLALDGAGCLAHPEHHRGQHDHGDEPDHALEQLLLLLRKLGRQQLQAGAGEQRQRGGQQHADPHRGHQHAAAALFQVTGNDADDQRGFDAFAQHDEKGNEHLGTEERSLKMPRCGAFFKERPEDTPSNKIYSQLGVFDPAPLTRAVRRCAR
ncbi:hypothetical protein D9M69_516770 [compost metagenome]